MSKNPKDGLRCEARNQKIPESYKSTVRGFFDFCNDADVVVLPIFLEWVLGAANFKVQMCPRRAAGIANATDNLALDDTRADRDGYAAQVCIKGLAAVRMFDDDVVSITAVPA